MKTRLLRLCAVGVSAQLLFQTSPSQTDALRFEEVSPPFPAIAYPSRLRARMLQDAEGFLWMSDGSHLYRYDGYQYRKFTGENGSSLFPNSWTLFEIAGGRHDYLCATAWLNQLLLYDIRKNSRRIFSLRQPGARGDRRVSCSLEDRAGRFWIGTTEGDLFRLSPSDFEVVRVLRQRDSTQPGVDVRALAEDSTGNLWFGGDRGLFRIPAAALDAQDLSAAGEMAQDLPWGRVAGLMVGRDGRLWVSMTNGSFGYIRKGGQRLREISSMPLPTGNVAWTMLGEDRNGDLWVGTPEDGLYRLKAENQTWERHLTRDKGRQSRDTDQIDFLFVDRSGMLWMKTSDRGLVRYFPPRRDFHSFPSSHTGGLILRGRDVHACRVDRLGTLWAGSFSGGLEYRPRGASQFTRLLHIPADPGSLSENSVIRICELKSGELWIGTVDRGINILERHTKSFIHLRHRVGDSTSLGSDEIKTLYEDRRGNVWVGHEAGLDRFDTATRTFSPVFQWPPETIYGLGSAASLCEDTSGNLWIGTYGRGLYRMDLPTGDTIGFHHDPRDPGSLPSDYVSSVFVDSLGRVWVGSSEGLSLFDRKSGRFTNIPIPRPYRTPPLDPAASPSSDNQEVRGILADRRGRLWLSLGDGGIGSFNIERHEFRRYSSKDGVVVTEGRRGAFFMSPDGCIYCGGSGGITWFFPDSVSEDDVRPHVAVVEFRVFDSPQRLSPGDTAAIDLSYTQNTFTFAYALLDYTNPEAHQFQYILEGADRDWGRAGQERSVTYADVPPGVYRFRVRGTNGNGLWSTNEADVAVIVGAPYWQRWWFRAILVCLACGILYTIHRYRLSSMLALEQLRLRIANDLHDDIGSALSGFALECDLIARRLLKEVPEQQRLSVLGERIRQASNTLRDAVWIISPDQNQLKDLIARMREITSVALADVKHEFHTAGILQELPLELEFRRQVLMMFKEILHNIVAHARASAVDISVEFGAGELRICVRDDGVGFDTALRHGGHGLKSLNSRASTIGARLTIHSTPGSGTSVLLSARIIHL